MDDNIVVVAVITLIGVMITAIFSFLTAVIVSRSGKEVSEINDAVNHRHIKKGPTALKLYDLVWENHTTAKELIEWKRSYDKGPLDDGHKVTEFVDHVNSKLQDVEDSIENLESRTFDSNVIDPDDSKQ